MLCGVTATLGSNPSATATAARPHWGRAVLLCLAGVPCGCVVPLVLLVAPRVFRAPEGPVAVCAGGRRPGSLMVLLVAPRVFRAPSGPAAREARASLRSAPRLEARPCPPVPPAPSTPAAPVVDRWLGASSRSPARPRTSKHALSSISHAIPSCLQSAALRKARNFNDYNSKHEVCVGELHANVCRLGPAVSCGRSRWALQGQAGRLSETPVAFAGAGRASTETAIAYAGEKRVFLVCFSGAEVMSVSMSPRCRALCAKKFALLGLMVGVSATKFAQRAQNGPNSAFLCLLGEFFRGNAAGGAVLGEFFRANRCCGQVL